MVKKFEALHFSLKGKKKGSSRKAPDSNTSLKYWPPDDGLGFPPGTLRILVTIILAAVVYVKRFLNMAYVANIVNK